MDEEQNQTPETPEGPEQQEVRFYEKLAARTADLLESGRKNFDEALKKAGEELAAASNFSREQAEKIGGYVRRDFTQFAEQADKARTAVKQAADPQRVAAGMQSTLSRILRSAAETLSELAAKTEKQLEHRTGEVTSPGTLTCRGCGAEMHFTATVRIPPCPKCHQTLFRKSY
jgi:predicted phage gp36 major capsid-like protein